MDGVTIFSAKCCLLTPPYMETRASQSPHSFSISWLSSPTQSESRNCLWSFHLFSPFRGQVVSVPPLDDHLAPVPASHTSLRRSPLPPQWPFLHVNVFVIILQLAISQLSYYPLEKFHTLGRAKSFKLPPHPRFSVMKPPGCEDSPYMPPFHVCLGRSSYQTLRLVMIFFPLPDKRPFVGTKTSFSL